jgi:hypothetical protein
MLLPDSQKLAIFWQYADAPGLPLKPQSHPSPAGKNTCIIRLTAPGASFHFFMFLFVFMFQEDGKFLIALTIFRRPVPPHIGQSWDISGSAKEDKNKITKR